MLKHELKESNQVKFKNFSEHMKKSLYENEVSKRKVKEWLTAKQKAKKSTSTAALGSMMGA